jgi:hypothetical protein
MQKPYRAIWQLNVHFHVRKGGVDRSKNPIVNSDTEDTVVILRECLSRVRDRIRGSVVDGNGPVAGKDGEERRGHDENGMPVSVHHG